MINHLGCRVRESSKLTREKYAIISTKPSLPMFKNMEDAYTNESGNEYDFEWCKNYQKKCLENFDLNMELFKSLQSDEFNSEIDEFLNTFNQFKIVSDLGKYDSVSGYYVMVLDEYKQLYIGTSTDIKGRIKEHWRKSKRFDRLLFPMDNVKGSIISIDCFKALDTTRILAYETENIYTIEDTYINYFSPKFINNRVGGGRVNIFEMISSIRTRSMVD